MKKRIITLLAILALLVTCAVVAVQADGDSTTPTYIDLTTFKCPCSACVANRESDATYIYPVEDWIEYTDGMNIRETVDGGHYYYDESLTPGGNITIGSGKEVVFVLDNMTLNIGGTSRAMTIGGTAGSILHIVGNNATVKSRSTGTSSTEGAFAQIYSGGELHLYGGVTIEKGTSTLPSASSGLFRMPTGSSLLHLHASTGMGLPANAGDPIIRGADLSGTGTSNQGGVAKLANSAATVTIDAGTVYGAKAGRGGAFYNNGGTININGGTIYGGQAGNRGGAIMNGAGTLNINGGTIIGDKDMTASYRTVLLAGGTCNFTGGTIISPNKGVGDGIAITNGTLNISGTATVKNNQVDANCTWDNNIWRWTDDSNTGVIQVDSEWTGSASVNIPGHSLTNHGGSFESSKLKYGTIANGVFTAGTSTTAKEVGLYLENDDHDNPKLAGYTGFFVTCRAALFEDGKLTGWSVVPSGAVLDYVDSDATEKYIKLWADYSVRINTTIYIDFNGRDSANMTHGDNGKIYAFDSSVDAGEVGAAITGTANEVVQPVTQIGGKSYVVVDNVIYPVEVAITSASLRLATAGIYYTAEVNADDAAKAAMTCGVAVKLETEVESLEDTAYTEGAATAEVNSIIVNSIVYEGKATKDRADKTIYAKAYLAYGDEVIFSEAKDLSLTELMTLVDAKVAEGAFEENQLTMIKAFYDDFAAAVEWSLTNIANIGAEA